MGQNAYTEILIQSLNKKIKILDKIVTANQKQRAQLEDPNLDPDDFDKGVEEKAALIDELNRLDEGFEETYRKVKDELDQNRAAYRDEITVMQDLIRKITDRSVTIQKQEKQNQDLMRRKFATVRKQIKEVRKSQKIVNQYYKNMMKRNFVEPQFMDNKK